MTTNVLPKSIPVILFYLLFSSLSITLSGQDTTSIYRAMDSLLALSDSAYGLDIELANGKIYYQKNLYAEGSPFYKTSDWIESKIIINGTKHQDCMMKYNIESDELILMVSLRSGLSTTIVLDPGRVEGFYLGKEHFIASAAIDPNLFKTHFLDEIYHGNISLLGSYSKVFIKDYNTKTPYGRYSETQTEYYLDKGGEIYKVNGKKSFLSQFPEHKREIQRYMKQHKFKFKKAGRPDWKELMIYCNSLEGERS